MIHDHSVFAKVLERRTYSLNETYKAEIVDYDLAFVMCVEFVDLRLFLAPGRVMYP